MSFSVRVKRTTGIAVGTLLFTIAVATSTVAQHPSVSYPKINGYVGLLHPITTYSRGSAPHYNFDGGYVVGMPTGINLWKTGTLGFSMEFVPIIRVSNGTHKMNNFLFHPGILFGLGRGFTLATRAAFESIGRYGFTPVLNKVVKKGANSSVFVAIPVPVRFGNDLPVSLSVGVQFGIVF